MIKVELLECLEDVRIEKNGTFTKGKLYLSRNTKDGGNIVALSNEGYWNTINTSKMSFLNVIYANNFKKKHEVFFKNKFELDDFIKSLGFHNNPERIKKRLIKLENIKISNIIMAELNVFEGMPNDYSTKMLMKSRVQTTLALYFGSK